MMPPGLRSRLVQFHWTAWLMVAILAMVAAVRLHLLTISLERDEGEYAYMGQLILQGVPPYEIAYNMKFPGTYLGYACFMSLFGETPAGIHLGVTLMTTATALMLFWLGKKMLDDVTGSIAASSYAILAACPSMMGLSGHATHFCAFFSTAGLCLLWQARQKETLVTLILSGTMFGAAVLMKQHAAFIGMWAGLAFAFEKIFRTPNPWLRRLVPVVTLAGGMFLPMAITALWLWHAGVFERFWFWSVKYAGQYVSILPWNNVPTVFRENFLDAISLCVPLWLLAAVGLVLSWFDERLRGKRLWLAGFLVASAATTCPGFYFRSHYFLTMLPAVALLGGVAAGSSGYLWKRKVPGSFAGQIPFTVAALLLALTIFINRALWFTVTPALATRYIFSSSPYLEAEKVAAYLRARLTPDKPIAVIGSEPEIPFLAHRYDATGYIYTYALMEPQPFASHMQADMIHEIETAAPEFIVYANSYFSWLQRPDSDLTIFKWWTSYQTNYTLVGVADVISPYETRYAWDADAVRYGHLRSTGLEVFHRNSTNTPASIPVH